ncbi:MAG: alpha/beta hydrolase domain-containing protein, partial [Gemmatimonadaceae bacterium]
MKSLRTLAFLLLASAVTSVPPRIAEARVVRVVVDRREPIGGGHVFGTGGPYERIVGKIFIALDPKNPHDTQIVDLALAPRNAQGEVEAWADFVMLRPTRVRKGAGVALIEVVNRGGGGATISTFSRDARRNLSPDSAAYYCDALLMRMGLTVVFLGWQFDVPVQPGLLRLHAPVATDHGRPITGLVRSDWTVDAAVHTLPLGHGVGNSQAIGYPVDNPDAAVDVLTVRDAPLAQRIVVPRAAWRFAREDSGRVVDDRTHIYMPAGFTPGKIYELVYGASDPVIVGTGLAMVRDVISYLKYDSSS